jgi:hypothetical protein
MLTSPHPAHLSECHAYSNTWATYGLWADAARPHGAPCRPRERYALPLAWRGAGAPRRSAAMPIVRWHTDTPLRAGGWEGIRSKKEREADKQSLFPN